MRVLRCYFLDRSTVSVSDTLRPEVTVSTSFGLVSELFLVAPLIAVTA
jgi:hypothetical protein